MTTATLTLKSSKEIAKTVLENAKQPLKLYRVEQLAEALGLSVSWVNLQISKDRPEVKAIHGKVHFYGNDYLDVLRSRGAKPRARRVQIIKRAVAAPVQKKIAQTRNVVATLADIANQSEPLFERLTRMEGETQRIEEMLVEISKFLGLMRQKQA